MSPPWTFVISGCPPTEAEDGEQEKEKAAATGREKRQSRPRERVREAGLQLQSFCLSL